MSLYGNVSFHTFKLNSFLTINLENYHNSPAQNFKYKEIQICMLDADNKQKMFGAFHPFLPVVRTFNSLKIHLYFYINCVFNKNS